MADKRLIVFIIIILLGLGAILGFWFVEGRPRTEPRGEQLPSLSPVEIIPRVPQATVSAYTLLAPLPAVSALPVYQYSTPDGAARERAVRWARNLGFGGEAEEIEDALRGKLYLWEKPGQTLIVDGDASSLSYSIDLLADPKTLSGSFLPNFDQATAIVTRTLLDLSISSNLLKPAANKSRYLKAGVSRAQPATAAEADLVEIHFAAAVDSYPLYTSLGPDQDPVVAWIGKDGKLLRLEYQAVGNLGEKLGDYPLKNREEVIADLNAGRGTVIGSEVLGGKILEAVAITRASLGYLLPSSGATTLQPIFILSSPALVIYLPAVKD